MPEQTSDLDSKSQLEILKQRAVRQAIFEFLGENRGEIVTRARAKLTAMGVHVPVDDAELPVP